MGCCTGLGRIILVILNLFFVLVSLALIAVGVILKFFANKFTKSIMGAVSANLDTQTKEDFNIPDLEDISDLPFLGEIGIAFMAFGGALFFVSFMACCGACYKWRPLLVVFIIVMTILVIVQGVVGGLFLAKNSVLHKKIKDTVGDKVKDDFKAEGDDVFSFAINIMQYLLGCCGIRGWSDFPGDKPPTCCLREIIDGDTSDSNIVVQQNSCVRVPSSVPASDYNSKGCYVLLQDKVLSNLTLSAVILAAILLLQVLEIIFAGLIIKDVNDASNKVGPY